MILDLLNLSESTTRINGGFEVEATNNGYDPSGAGAAQIVQESMIDMHKLNTAMAVADYKTLVLISESHQSEAIVLQESILGDFFKKIKEIILKLWAKLQELFNNVKLFFSKAAGDDKFLDTYKKELEGADLTDFEYEGHDYKLDAITLAVDTEKITKNTKVGDLITQDPEAAVKKIAGMSPDGAKTESEKITNVMKEKEEIKKNILGEIRAKIAGEGSNLDDGDFKTKVFEKLRGGDKKTLSISTSTVVQQIKDKDKSIRAVETARREAAKTVTDTLKFVDDCIKALDKSVTEESVQEKKNAIMKYAEVLRFVASARQSALNVLSTAAGYKVDAIKEAHKQNRDIAHKVLVHSRKRKKVNESSEFSGEGSVLSEIMNRLG